MRTLKYSRQREYIKSCLAATNTHPTASDIYQTVKEEFPKISLGTVYRNLSLLVDLGEARRLSDTNGTDHFDAITKPHAHFVCNVCSRVRDFASPIEQAAADLAEDGFTGEITDYDIYFYGKCPACAAAAADSAEGH